MTRLLTTAAAAALALSAAGAAQAQDWQGGYIGVHAGFASPDEDAESVQFDTDLDGRFDDTVLTSGGADAFGPGFCDGAARTNVPAGGCTDDDDGGDFGVRAGYDWQMGGWVFGALVEYSALDMTDSVSAYSTTPASYTFTREIDATVAVRGRVGYAFDRFLGYATAGVARADVTSSFETTNGVNTFVERGEDDADGYQLGLGGETRVWGNWSLGLEYLYTSLEDDGYRVRAQGPAPATNPFILVNPAGTDLRRDDGDFEYHTVRLTAAWRF